MPRADLGSCRIQQLADMFRFRSLNFGGLAHLQEDEKPEVAHDTGEADKRWARAVYRRQPSKVKTQVFSIRLLYYTLGAQLYHCYGLRFRVLRNKFGMEGVMTFRMHMVGSCPDRT